MIARKLRLLASVAALAGCGVFATPVIAQGGGIDRTVLPIPLPAFDGVIGRTVEESRGDGRASTPVEAPAGAPNILLILLDDAGYAQTSTFGGPIATPVLDQLAKNGLRYPRFQVDSMCSPTRAALLGG